MKITDFSKYLQKFFTEYLPGVNGNSPATIDTYRYAFIRLLEFMAETNSIDANKLTISDITYSNIVHFYEWLEVKYHNGVKTRNVRQSAINSFVTFLMYEYPDYMREYQKILSIPFKKTFTNEISYIKSDGMKLLLEQIDQSTPAGFRDYVIMSLFCTTGIRVSELINIRVKDVMLQDPPTLLVHGKGGKSRYVPIVKQVVSIIQKYLADNKLDRPERRDDFLFLNHMDQQFTRQGINYLVSKYKIAVNEDYPGSIPDDFSPHKLRHSAAMNLLAADVDLIYIRDLLGHTSVQTTEIYARADSQRKRAAIEAASKELVEKEPAKWDSNEDLKDWLKSFGRR